VRLRQSLGPWLRMPELGAGVALGAVLPTGEYVARTGAANLPPEASYLTLGRGVPWWIVEGNGTYRITKRVLGVGQIGARGPVGRTSDELAWGPEVRAAFGARTTLHPRISALLLTDLQWRGGATEPDPFGAGRLDAANAGGWLWSVSPGVALALPGNLAVTAGLRIPIYQDVTGNQLVPQIGGFVGLAYSQPVIKPPPPKVFEPPAGQITVVDYWATWCAPCTAIERALTAAAPRWPDVRIVRIDATSWPGDDAPQLPAGARGLPVVEVFDRNGARKVMLTGDAASRVVQEVDALRGQSP
jgi:thiol-disulfide isomerase/thioredoxin